MTSAAVADVLAWVLLALVVVLASSAHDWNAFARQIGGLLLLAAVIFGLFRPLIAWLLARYASDGRPAGALLAALLIGTFACAYGTDYLGVHAVFGAFLFGACLPRDDRLLHSLIERIEHVALLVLMPVFFALAGLNTTPDAFIGAGLGGLGLILAAAIIGKVAGAGIGARISGQPWRESLAVGSLHERARPHGAHRDQGRAGHRGHREGALHHAARHGAPDYDNDQPAADVVLGGPGAAWLAQSSLCDGSSPRAP